MCGDHPNRPSRGGAVAIMKRIGAANANHTGSEMSIRLADSFESTIAMIEGGELRGGQLLIHFDGDLRSTSAAEMHRISIPDHLQPGMPFRLRTRLQLGVGDEGIIGRRASFKVGGKVVSEGVVGWD